MAVRSEFKDEDIGVFHDGTTFGGEAFAIVARACLEDFTIIERAARVHWFRGSLSNVEITPTIVTTVSYDLQVLLSNVLDIGNDDASPNGLNYENLQPILPYADEVMSVIMQCKL